MGIHMPKTLPVTGVGHHGGDDASRYHPVAENAADEEGQHAGGAMGGIAERAAFADMADASRLRRRVLG